MYYAAAVSFELKDGRLLECKFTMPYTPASYWQPSEIGEPSDPEFYLEGEEIDPKDTIKGLNKLCEAMYCNSNDKRFTYDGDLEYDE